MSALRLARASTRRDRIITFAGCYHGHADALLASAGSGLATLGIPASPAFHPGPRSTRSSARTTTSMQSRPRSRAGRGAGLHRGRAGGREHGRRPAGARFLEALRSLCDASGALLVFDEVITGFRVARGGAQERFGVTPDLTILGKIVGGGLPLAAFGAGRT
jgi:glutamate-1-semialdehyde 2,1-aminomutase